MMPVKASLLYRAMPHRGMNSRVGPLGPLLFILFVGLSCSQANGDLITDVPTCSHLDTSAWANYTFDIDHQVSAAYFSLSWKKDSNSLELGIRSPGGGLVRFGPGSYVNRVSGQTSVSYIVPKPQVGVWRLEVRSAELPKDGEDYCLSARLQEAPNRSTARFNGLYRDYGTENDDGFTEHVTLVVGVDVEVAGNYSVEGSLYDVKSGQEIQASNSTFMEIGSRTVELDLHGMNSSGPYRLKHLDLYDEQRDKIDTTTANFTTKAYNIQNVSLQSARLSDSYTDYPSYENANVQFNYLTVDADIDVFEQGNYSLMGSLYDALGGEVVWSTGFASFDPGNHIIHMDFDGKTLNGHKFNGTYHLRDLILYSGDSKEDLTLQDLVDDAYTTKPYNYTQFVDPAWPEKVLAGSGKGEFLLTIMIKSTLPVFQGRYSEDIVGVNMPPISSNWTIEGSERGYSYNLPGIYMPNKPNNFTILARGVKNLHVGVRKDPTNPINFTRAWISAQAVAGADGTASIDNDMISPGRYLFKVFGDAAENVSQVALEMKVVKKLLIDGRFRLSLNTSGFPSGNYSFSAKALNGSMRLDEIEMEDGN
jgi:hypothetical protein